MANWDYTLKIMQLHCTGTGGVPASRVHAVLGSGRALCGEKPVRGWNDTTDRDVTCRGCMRRLRLPLPRNGNGDARRYLNGLQ